MTTRLYLNDSHITECAATVTACTFVEGGYDVELDQTVFFPTGGGQPHDTGALDDIPVTDVTEEGERVLHRTTSPIEPGRQVHAKIDWARRFDHMQQHSGEHLISFAAKELFDLTNVGFHMAAASCTVDFDAPLTREQLDAIEARTNALACALLPVTLQYVDAEQLANTPLRKSAKGLEGTVRIVYMQHGDSCTCCGTHVSNTGEIGAVKIISGEHYKGGERITFLCGARAVYHAQHMQQIIDALAREHSCKAEDVPIAIEKAQKELSEVKRENKVLYARLNEYICDTFLMNAKEYKGVILITELVDMPVQNIKPLALSICKKKNSLVLLCAYSGSALHYVLCCSDTVKLDMGELIEAINVALGGRGGGRNTLAQGSAPNALGVSDTLMQLNSYLAKRLHAR